MNTTTPCQTCGEPAHAHDRFCETCGTPNPAHPAARIPPSTPRLAASVLVGECGDCGGGAVGADGFCEWCGMRQDGGRGHVETDLGVVGAAVSDAGLRRRRNEDAFAIVALPPGAAAVVCDGVATAPGSDEASRRAADAGLAVLTGRVSVGMDPQGATRAALDAGGRDNVTVAVIPCSPSGRERR